MLTCQLLYHHFITVTHVQCEMIEFYYHWKKTPMGLDTRGIRKQKKQHHIKTARQYYLSQQDSGQEYGMGSVHVQ